MSTSHQTDQLTAPPRLTKDRTLILEFRDAGRVEIPRNEWEPYYNNGKLDDSFFEHLDEWYRNRLRELHQQQEPTAQPFAEALSDTFGLDWKRMSHPQKLATARLVNAIGHGLETGELPVPPDPRTLPRRVAERLTEDLFYVFPAAKPVHGPAPYKIHVGLDPILGPIVATTVAQEAGETIAGPRQFYGELGKHLPSQMAYRGFDIGVPDSWPGHLRTRSFLQSLPQATKPRVTPERQHPPVAPYVPPDPESARIQSSYLDVRNIPLSHHIDNLAKPPWASYWAPPESVWTQAGKHMGDIPLSEYIKDLTRQRVLPPKPKPRFSIDRELFYDRGVAGGDVLWP